MHSRYMGYSMYIKSMAFIPTIIGFITFLSLIALYGRVSKEAQMNAANATVADVADQRSMQSLSHPSEGSTASSDGKKESISMTRLVKADIKPSRQSSTDSAEPLSLKDGCEEALKM